MSYKEVFRFSVFTFCFLIAYGPASSVFLEFWFPRLRSFVFSRKPRQDSFQYRHILNKTLGGLPLSVSPVTRQTTLALLRREQLTEFKLEMLSERNGFEVRRDLGPEGEASLLGWLWWL